MRRFVGLANYFKRFCEGYAELAAPLTALASPTAHFKWTPAAQASFVALKQGLVSAPVLRTFNPARRSVLTTDASGLAVAAILTQPDDEGHQHPVAYESSKLTAMERAYQAHVLELLSVVHALRVFKHYLLGSGDPRPDGDGTDFDLRTDNQAIRWLKTNSYLNKMYVRWLNDIAGFRFTMKHLPGSRNPADPLMLPGFPDGDGPPASTCDRNPESRQELFSRFGRDAPEAGTVAALHAGWQTTRRAVAAVFATCRPGGAPQSTPRSAPARGQMFVALAGATLPHWTGAPAAATPLDHPDAHFLAQEFVECWATHIAVDPFFGPILHGAAATLGKLVDSSGTPILEPSRQPKGGAFLVRFGRTPVSARSG